MTCVGEIGVGYDRYKFATDVEGGQEVGYFIKQFNNELSAYYTIGSYRSTLLDISSAIFEQIALIANPGDGRKFSFMRKFFRDSRIINSAYNALLNERMVSLELSRYMASAKSDSDIDENSMLYKHLKRYLDDMPSAPLEEIKDILRINEDRHQKFIGNSFALSSAILGALIGAVVTFMVSTHSYPKQIASPRFLQFQIPALSEN